MAATACRVLAARPLASGAALARGRAAPSMMGRAAQTSPAVKLSARFMHGSISNLKVASSQATAAVRGMRVFSSSAGNTIPAPEDVAAAPADAEVTDSGLATRVLIPGEGSEKPDAVDEVTVDYTGWTTDGKMFDSSVTRGAPATFPLNMVIKGWTEGLQLMVVGEKRRLWIPEELAYRGQPGRPAGMLVFDVELHSIKTKPKPPPVPEDVGGIYDGTEVTASGLGHKLLKAGTGDKNPFPTDRVTVHYTGWTTDGQMFDSSVTRGETVTFPLNQVIKGWTEGLQLMVEGESRRFWIPAELAYGTSPPPGAPAGMLVFDVELFQIN